MKSLKKYIMMKKIVKNNNLSNKNNFKIIYFLKFF